MPIILAKRDPAARELMDSADCDPNTLYNTYRQFRFINVFLSRSKSIYRHWIRPAMAARPRKTHTLLDIGFGGGDIPLKLAQWAEKDGFDLQITAIEIDARAHEYAQTLERPENVTFQLRDVHDLAASHARYDFVISNHMVHHLGKADFYTMLENAARICVQRVVFVDLKRSDLAYFLFAILTLPFFRNSYIRADGLTSLRRSYTLTELRKLMPPDWIVTRLFPFRLIVSFTRSAEHAA